MKKGIHIVNLKKSKTKVYVTVLLFILYSIWVHIESPKYKMICLKSPKSSEFAKNNYKNSGQKSLCCNNLLIELLKIGKLKNWKHLRRDSNPQHLSLRLRNTCAIGCAKETTENVFKTCTMPLTCSMSRDGEYTMSWYIHISVSRDGEYTLSWYIHISVSRDGEYTLSWYIQLSNCDTWRWVHSVVIHTAV